MSETNELQSGLPGLPIEQIPSGEVPLGRIRARIATLRRESEKRLRWGGVELIFGFVSAIPAVENFLGISWVWALIAASSIGGGISDLVFAHIKANEMGVLTQVLAQQLVEAVEQKGETGQPAGKIE